MDLGSGAGILIVGGFVLVLSAVGYSVAVFNRLATARVRMQNSFGQIDVQLKRRFDLIPNLVETVKGYMIHERQTLESVILARNAALDGLNALGPLGTRSSADGVALVSDSVGALDGNLRRLMGLVEAYPDLKASKNVLELQEQLGSTENRIAFARQAYNDSVMRYNTLRVVFPQNMVASLFGFQPGVLFGATEDERAVPTVKM